MCDADLPLGCEIYFSSKHVALRSHVEIMKMSQMLHSLLQGLGILFKLGTESRDFCLSQIAAQRVAPNSSACETQHHLLGGSGKNTLSNKGWNAFCSMFPELVSGQKTPNHRHLGKEDGPEKNNDLTQPWTPTGPAHFLLSASCWATGTAAGSHAYQS